VGYRLVHSDGFGDTVHPPFRLAYIEVEQDPSAGLILKRADRTVELVHLVMSHTPSLSVPCQRESTSQQAGAPRLRGPPEGLPKLPPEARCRSSEDAQGVRRPSRIRPF